MCRGGTGASPVQAEQRSAAVCATINLARVRALTFLYLIARSRGMLVPKQNGTAFVVPLILIRHLIKHMYSETPTNPKSEFHGQPWSHSELSAYFGRDLCHLTHTIHAHPIRFQHPNCKLCSLVLDLYMSIDNSR